MDQWIMDIDVFAYKVFQNFQFSQIMMFANWSAQYPVQYTHQNYKSGKLDFNFQTEINLYLPVLGQFVPTF